MIGRSSVVGLVCVALVLLFTATASATQPSIAYTIDGISGTSGWYRGRPTVTTSFCTGR